MRCRSAPGPAPLSSAASSACSCGRAGLILGATGRAAIGRTRCRTNWSHDCADGGRMTEDGEGTKYVSRRLSSVSDHQHRAFGVAHHVAGIGAEEVRAHRVPLRPMRAHDDEIGMDAVRLLEDLLIDPTLA